MSATFRIGWGDRLRALLTGRVRHVRATTAPVVFRSQHEGASVSVDHDAFGFYFGQDTIRWFWDDRPLLTVAVPSDHMGIACPCCRQCVDVRLVRKPPAAEMALVALLKRMDRRTDGAA